MSNTPNPSYEQFVRWFFTESEKGSNTQEDFFNSYITHLINLGIPFSRVNFGRRALHPQVSSISCLWLPNGEDSTLAQQPTDVATEQTLFRFPSGSILESKFPIGSFSLPGFQKSPINFVMQTRQVYFFDLEEFRVSGKDPKDLPFPILEDFLNSGCTSYLVCPQILSNIPFGIISFVTKSPGGFSPEVRNFLIETSHLFSMKWNQFAQQETLDSLLQIYLGKQTGSRVSAGKILRGDFEEIRSVIWFSDIRNFTGISEGQSSEALIELLNEYFEICIPIIESLDGEVLKMIGDGLLAVFPFEEETKVKTHYKSLLAARRILKKLGQINIVRRKDNKPLIEHGVGLHFGQVMYGNIGSKERLDFTVIGEAVNLSSRIAGLCGQLGKAVLASEEFARETSIHWQELGEYSLKGIANKRKIFGIPQAEEMAEKFRYS